MGAGQRRMRRHGNPIQGQNTERHRRRCQGVNSKYHDKVVESAGISEVGTPLRTLKD